MNLNILFLYYLQTAISSEESEWFSVALPIVWNLVFFLLDWLSSSATKPSLSFYSTHSWKEKEKIHTFPQGISANMKTIDENKI